MNTYCITNTRFYILNYVLRSDYRNIYNIIRVEKFIANEELFKAMDLSDNEEYEKAIEIFDKVIHENPKNDQALNERAYAKASLGDDYAALEDYQKLI